MKLLMQLHIPLFHLRLLAIVQIFLAAQFFAQAQPVAESMIIEARGAVLTVELRPENSGVSISECGALLNAQGWAVVPLNTVSYSEPPVFRNSKGKVLEFKRVLAVDAVVSIAIVELDYPNSPALRLAAKPPEAWEEIALLWDSRDEQGFDSGPVLARRPCEAHGPGSPESLCLGMRILRGISPACTGSPVINASGELVGIFDQSKLDAPNYPMRILAISSEPIGALLGQAKDNPRGLPFPLKEAYPYDSAYWEYHLSQATMERDRAHLNDEEGLKQKQKEKIAQVRKLVEKHPGSAWAAEQLIRELIGDLMLLYSMNGGTIHDDDPAAPLRDAMRTAVSSATKEFSHLLKDPWIMFTFKTQDAGQRKDYKKLIALHLDELKKWGESPPLTLLAALAEYYYKDDNPEVAAKYFQQIAKVAPDSLFNLYRYRRLLISLRDFDEEERIGDLIERVENAYRPR